MYTYSICSVSGYELGVDFCRATTSSKNINTHFLLFHFSSTIQYNINLTFMFISFGWRTMMIQLLRLTPHIFSGTLMGKLCPKWKWKSDLNANLCHKNSTLANRERKNDYLPHINNWEHTREEKKTITQKSISTDIVDNAQKSHIALLRYCGSSVSHFSAQFKFRFSLFFRLEDRNIFCPLYSLSHSLWVFSFAQIVCSKNKSEQEKHTRISPTLTVFRQTKCINFTQPAQNA